jgi:hypothetical protein
MVRSNRFLLDPTWRDLTPVRQSPITTSNEGVTQIRKLGGTSSTIVHNRAPCKQIQIVLRLIVTSHYPIPNAQLVCRAMACHLHTGEDCALAMNQQIRTVSLMIV